MPMPLVAHGDAPASIIMAQPHGHLLVRHALMSVCTPIQLDLLIFPKDRHGAHHHVAIGAIERCQPRLHLIDTAALERSDPAPRRLLPILGMHGVQSGPKP